MPNINISQGDFDTIAGALYAALKRGDREEAKRLDKIARKINAALTARPYDPHMGLVPRFTWKDVPSLLETLEQAGVL